MNFTGSPVSPYCLCTGITGKLLIIRQAMSFQFNMTPPHMVNIATFGHSLNIFPGSEVSIRSLSDKIHQKTDIIRRLYLGVSPPDWLRSCTRYVHSLILDLRYVACSVSKSWLNKSCLVVFTNSAIWRVQCFDTSRIFLKGRLYFGALVFNMPTL